MAETVEIELAPSQGRDARYVCGMRMSAVRIENASAIFPDQGFELRAAIGMLFAGGLAEGNNP